MVPVGSNIDRARALGGSEVDVVNGGNGGDVFVFGNTSDGINTTTHADVDTIHIDTSTDTIHIATTQQITEAKQNAGGALSNDDTLVELLQSSVRQCGERAIGLNRSRKLCGDRGKQEVLGSPTPAVVVRGDNQSGTCPASDSVDVVDNDSVCDVRVGDLKVADVRVESSVDCNVGNGGSVGCDVGNGGVEALRVDTCFSVMDLGSCSCDLIGATVDGYFIVHDGASLSASNQTGRLNHGNANNTNDNEATNCVITKLCTVGLIGPQTRHRPSDSGDDLMALESEVHAGSLGSEKEQEKKGSVEKLHFPFFLCGATIFADGTDTESPGDRVTGYHSLSADCVDRRITLDCNPSSLIHIAPASSSSRATFPTIAGTLMQEAVDHSHLLLSVIRRAAVGADFVSVCRDDRDVIDSQRTHLSLSCDSRSVIDPRTFGKVEPINAECNTAMECDNGGDGGVGTEVVHKKRLSTAQRKCLVRSRLMSSLT